MNKRKLLMIVLALFTLNVLNMNLVSVSAVPVSPYIMVVPSSKTISSFVQNNRNYTVSIYTDYNGWDVWGWQVSLTFNTAVLECIEIRNGDLINTDDDPSAVFNSRINNTVGEVGAGAFFYYDPGYTPFTTNGPGNLTHITFRVVGSGISSLTLGKDTKLQGYDAVIGESTIIIDESHPPGPPGSHIGHGIVTVTIGDVNGDSKVNVTDLFYMGIAYGSTAGPPSSYNWNPNCDFNSDDIIDNSDLTYLNENYGKSW